MRDLRDPRRAALTGLLAVLLLFFALGSYGLLEDNEARFFEISWEMERSGDWLTPRLNFIPHFHKPPGTFWLVGASLRLLGESEWAGRVPVALASLVTLTLCWLWARSEDGEQVAARTVLVLVTSIEFWFLSRLVLTDMFLTVSVTAALFFAWRARSRPATEWWWLGFWLALAASAMFKGPIGLAIVIPVLALSSLSMREKRPWNLRPGPGIAVFLLLSLPWYALVCAQHEGLLGYFLKFQTAQRMLTTVHGRPGAWWFYLPVLLGGFFPWSTGLPATLRAAWRRGEDFDRFLLCWIGFPLLFFSCSGSKLPTYLLPIFPALALLTARASRTPGLLRALGSTALATVAVFAGLVAAYLTVGPAPEITPATLHLWALAAWLAVLTVLALVRRPSSTEDRWFAIPGWGFAVGLLILASALGPCDGAYSARSLAASLRRETPEAVVVEVADHLHGLPFYLDRRIVQVAYPRETQFDEPADYAPFLFPDLPAYLAAYGRSKPTVLILRRSDYERYADPSWPVRAAGPWRVVQVGESPPTPASERAANGPPAGPVGGGAGL